MIIVSPLAGAPWNGSVRKNSALKILHTLVEIRAIEFRVDGCDGSWVIDGQLVWACAVGEYQREA